MPPMQHLLRPGLGFLVALFVAQYLVQHELRKRILRRLRTEGTEMFPTRTVELRTIGGPSQVR